jgi:hypothetical protein
MKNKTPEEVRLWQEWINPVVCQKCRAYVLGKCSKHDCGVLEKKLSRCTGEHDWEPCKGRYLTTGELVEGCGDACSFVMRKGGAGDPPFETRTRKYVGGVPFPGEDWV